MRSNSAAEVAQCFEVWLCFEGEEYLVYEAASYGRNPAGSMVTMALMGQEYVECETEDVVNDSELTRQLGGQYVSYLVGSEY